MQRTDKERVVAELAEQLRSVDSLIVADYRGLTNAELAELRSKVRGSGGRLQVVKNTLTRRAAEEAGSDSLLALLEGPTAIAFIETDGDPVAVAKALAETARETKILALRGGILSGRALTGEDVEELAKLPAPEVVKSQLVGASSRRSRSSSGCSRPRSAICWVCSTPASPSSEESGDTTASAVGERRGERRGRGGGSGAGCRGASPRPTRPGGDATSSTETDAPAEPSGDGK